LLDHGLMARWLHFPVARLSGVTLPMSVGHGGSVLLFGQFPGI